MTKGTPKKNQQSEARSFAEWVTLFVSCTLLACVIGFLSYRVVTQSEERTPLEFKILREEVRAAGDHFVVPIEVYNPGNRTLSILKIEAAYPGVGADAKTVVTEIEIDYLAEQGRENVYLILDHEPKPAEISLRPLYFRLN